MKWNECPMHGPATENIWACPECMRQLRTLATRLVRDSGRGYDCLPDGWIAVRAEPFDDLRRALVPNELTGGASAPSSDRRERG